jgi:hypothetical protein
LKSNFNTKNISSTKKIEKSEKLLRFDLDGKRIVYLKPNFCFKECISSIEQDIIDNIESKNLLTDSLSDNDDENDDVIKEWINILEHSFLFHRNIFSLDDIKDIAIFCMNKLILNQFVVNLYYRDHRIVSDILKGNVLDQSNRNELEDVEKDDYEMEKSVGYSLDDACKVTL